MELSPFASPAAQRRLIVDVLMLCFERSKLGEQLQPAALRPAIEAAMGEMWRGQTLALEPVWKLLEAEGGLDLREAAVPLAAFSTFASDLEVEVVLPEALRSLPPERRAELRDYLQLGEEHVRMMRLHQQKAAVRQARTTGEVPMVPHRSSGERPVTLTPSSLAAPGPRRTSKEVPAVPARRSSPEIPAVAAAGAGTRLALKIAGLTVAAAVTVSGVGSYSSSLPDFDPQSPCDVEDVATIVQLEGGRRDGLAMAAQVVDSKWAALSGYQKQRLAVRVFEVEAPKGVHLLKLSDATGRLVVVDDRGGRKRIAIR